MTCLTARGLPDRGDERDAFLDRYLELCADLDCRLLKISSDPAWLREAAERAQAHGVALAGNNHVGTDLQTASGTRRMLAQVGHPNYGLLYDSAHLRMAGEDYVDCIPSLLPHTRNVLVHSFRHAVGAEPPFLVHDGQGWVNALPDAAGVQDWAGDPVRLQAARLRRSDHGHRERLERGPARDGRPPQRRLYSPLVGPLTAAAPWLRTMTSHLGIWTPVAGSA